MDGSGCRDPHSRTGSSTRLAAQLPTVVSTSGDSAASRRREPDPGSAWRPPDPGALKVNIDGAFNPGSTTGSTAYICRDHEGKLIEGFTRTISAHSALEVEIQALIVALQHLKHENHTETSLIFEIDCLALGNGDERPSDVSMVGQTLDC